MKDIYRLAWHGFLVFAVWTIAAFIGYSFTGTGDRPTFLGTVIALIIILPATYSIGKRFARTCQMSAFVYSTCMAFGVFVLNVLITIPNGTTEVFLGSGGVYATFLGIFIGSNLGTSKSSKRWKA